MPVRTTGDETVTLPPTLAGYQAAAQAVLDRGADGYINGGAADEWTLAENLASWQRISIVPRVLAGGPPVDTATTVLGSPLPHPIIVAPMAYQCIATPEGEIATARAAAATSTILTLSTLSNVAAPAVAAAVAEVRRWFQVYVFTDRGVTHHLIEEALMAGYEALVVTVDFPAVGVRDRDDRTGFVVDTAVPAMSAAGLGGDPQPKDASCIVDPRLSWDDIASLASRYGVPLLVKGILAWEDGERAVAEGAAGIIVSNHGGRQLDGSAGTATVLAEIVDAVAGRASVLVDGGIRRGVDVFRAIALGADAVMVGRPVYWGLAVGGAAGAQHVLELLIEEFRNSLILSGANSATALNRGFLRMKQP